jgi:hypothetical protein
MVRAAAGPETPQESNRKMRAETENLVDEIKQAIGLLRRHL